MLQDLIMRLIIVHPLARQRRRLPCDQASDISCASAVGHERFSSQGCWSCPLPADTPNRVWTGRLVRQMKPGRSLGNPTHPSWPKEPAGPPVPARSKRSSLGVPSSALMVWTPPNGLT
jgi:hypothetical protein